MAVYFVLYAFLILAAFSTGVESEDYKNKKILTCFTILLICILALRHPSMGWDLQYGKSYGYLGSFAAISNKSFKELLQLNGWLNYEWGYILFNKIISIVSNNSQWLLVCCAIASCIPISIAIRKYSKEVALSAIIYLGLPCFLMSFSGLRQAIAIGICCLSFRFITERKPIKFIVLVVVASLFHSTAVLFLIAYPVFHLRISHKQRLWTIPLIGIVFLLRQPLFIILSRLVKDEAAIDNNNALTLLVVYVLVYIFCYLFIEDDDTNNGGFLNIFYLAVLCQCFGGVNQLSIRVGYYFMPALAIALPNIISYMNSNNYKVSKLIVLFAFSIFGLYELYVSGNSWPCTYPYHFFWSVI